MTENVHFSAIRRIFIVKNATFGLYAACNYFSKNLAIPALQSSVIRALAFICAPDSRASANACPSML